MKFLKLIEGVVIRPNWLCALMGLAVAMTTMPAVDAAEKDGLLVDIQKRIIRRNDRAASYYSAGTLEVDRTMSLKLDVTNKSMRDIPAGEVTYAVLIQRWTSEKADYQRFEGSVPLEALRAANKAGLFLGEFSINGHMHGTSEMHVDQFVAWKVVIDRGDKKVEFASPRFEALNKQARKAN